MATEPKLIDAGATEIVAAPGVLCWLDWLWGVLVIPMQPELHRRAKSRRTRAATGIALLPTELACVTHFPAPPNHSLTLNFFIAPIVVCGKGWDYCPNVHLKDRGGDLHLAHRCGGGRTPPTLRGPPNWIRLTPAPIYGTVAETCVE